MRYIITNRDKWMMGNIFIQLFRLMVLSLKFMKLTNASCALPPRPKNSSSPAAIQQK